MYADSAGDAARAVPRPRRASASVLLLLAFVAAALYLWPSALGGCTTFTIVSGHSMEPTYSPGDVVMSRCGADGRRRRRLPAGRARRAPDHPPRRRG